MKNENLMQPPVSKSASNFKCNTCDKTFDEKQSYYLHISNYHGGSQKVVCHMCKKIHKDAHTLRVHLEKFHKQRLDSISTDNLKKTSKQPDTKYGNNSGNSEIKSQSQEFFTKGPSFAAYSKICL